MSVSVVMPLFNGARWLRETLASVFAQTRKPGEIIVVDDGSSDGSVDIIREFPGIILLENSAKGANPARRLGVAHSTSKYVAMLDQDDHWHPQHLSVLEEILEANPDYPAVFAQVCRFHTLNQLKYSQPEPDYWPLDPWHVFPANITSTPSAVLIRRSRLDEIEGWPTQYIGVTDYYTWLRIAADHDLLENRSVSVGRRVHRTSYSWRLRENDYTGHVNNLVSAANDGLMRRGKTSPAQMQRLTTRLEALRLVPKIITSALHPEPAQLGKTLNTFAHHLDGEPADIDRRMCDMINWYIQPFKSLKTDSVSQNINWKKLLVDCLHDREMLSRAIADKISVSIDSLNA